MKKKRERRRGGKAGKIVLNILLSLLLVAVIVLLFGANIEYNRKHYTPEFYRISSDKIAERVRIVYLSDLHLREYGEANSELLEDIEMLSPDIILLGGDLVVYIESEYGSMISFCESLASIAPTLGVWGNHEDVKMYIQGDKELRTAFESTGVRFLTNEIERVKIGESDIVICGLDGTSANFEKYGASEAMEAFEEIYDGFKICLEHVPTYFTERLTSYDFDLGIAGHTHGGIVRIPRFGPLYSAEEGFFPKYAAGEYMLENGARLIVSRGLGDTQDSVRINNVPELTVIDLE